MPYIKKNIRAFLTPTARFMTGPGDLNFTLTKVCQQYLDNSPVSGYQSINDILGALEGCKLEFYRRYVVPYEDNKIKENGDVY